MASIWISSWHFSHLSWLQLNFHCWGKNNQGQNILGTEGVCQSPVQLPRSCYPIVSLPIPLETMKNSVFLYAPLFNCICLLHRKRDHRSKEQAHLIKTLSRCLTKLILTFHWLHHCILALLLLYQHKILKVNKVLQ